MAGIKKPPIIVLFEGKVIAEYPSDTDPNIIGLAMAGEN